MLLSLSIVAPEQSSSLFIRSCSFMSASDPGLVAMTSGTFCDWPVLRPYVNDC
jgi:hypothetical protein